MKNTKLLFVSVLVLICSLGSQQISLADKINFDYVIPAKIIRVFDGDTVKIWLPKNNVGFRLNGIDCYETSNNRHLKYQQGKGLTDEEIFAKGLTAKNILKDKLNEHSLYYAEIIDVDRYGRLVGNLYYKDGKGKYYSINEEMKATGYCPEYIFKKKRTY